MTFTPHKVFKRVLIKFNRDTPATNIDDNTEIIFRKSEIYRGKACKLYEDEDLYDIEIWSYEINIYLFSWEFTIVPDGKLTGVLYE